jgi:hypothetical protein
VSEHEKRLREWLESFSGRADAEDALANLDAALSSARDAALEEAKWAVLALKAEASVRLSGNDQDAFLGGLDVAEERICALQSAPASVVCEACKVRPLAPDDVREGITTCAPCHNRVTPGEFDDAAASVLPTAKVREVLLGVRRYGEARIAEAIATQQEPLMGRGISLSAGMVAERLGVDLDATGEPIDWAAVVTGGTVRTAPAAPREMATGHINCTPSCPGWEGARERATESNGLLPAPLHQECGERHAPDAVCGVYDEPAHEVPPGTCKGCDAPADAPREEHRFSCSVYGKGQVKAGANMSDPSGKVKR